MTQTSFESTLHKVQEALPALIPDLEVYLVSNIYTQLALYLVDAPEERIKDIRTYFLDLIPKIEGIKIGDFIYQDLQKSRELIGGNESRIFFVNRHIDKTNWYLTPYESISSKAHVVAFYSFKGGLGRTTALVLSALQLTRQGKKVVLIDFDLEAPGLGPLFQNDFPEIAKVRGTADFLLDWQARNQEVTELDLANYYFTINQQDLVGTQGGELVIFPATYSESNDELAMNYIDKLSKLNIQYNELDFGNYAPDVLINQIDKSLAPDFILIDTRTGINDIGGLVLQRYANSAFLFFQGNSQNMFGLEALLPKLLSFGLPFYLINSPTPREPVTREQEVAYFLTNSYNIFSSIYYTAENLPDIQDDTANHYPINIPYTDTATFLNSSLKLQSLLEERGFENPYLQLANYMLVDTTSILPTEQKEHANYAVLVKAMSEIINEAAASETELNNEEELRKNFYPRVDYRFIFDRNKFLILGEKGSGKTALYAVLSQANYARDLAKFCGVNSRDWERTIWIKGLDRKGELYPSSVNFAALTGLKDIPLRNYWLILLCREINNTLQFNILLNEKIANAPFAELRILSQDYALNEELENYLSQINKSLVQEDKYITVIYDYLDSLLTEENDLRGLVVGALLRLWYEYHNRFSNLRAKIFLRKDIYDREIPTGLTDKVKFNNFKQEIEWNLPQLLNMVWKRILERATDDGKLFITPVLDGVPILQEPRLGIIPNLSQEQHTKLLEKVFGKRMGGNNKAFPYKWIEQHIADTFRHIQPRSILNLFGLGAREQIEDISNTITLIRPQNFESVLREVSTLRVRDLEEEYPVLQPIFNELKEYVPQFPAQEAELQKALTNIKEKHPMTQLVQRDVKDIIQELINVGVLYEYKFNRIAIGGIRYHIPDLYLFGLGLTRKGPGASKNIFDIQRRISRRS